MDSCRIMEGPFTMASGGGVTICSCHPVKMTVKTYEVEITVINAKNERHTRHVEYDSSMDTPEGAANEMVYEIMKGVGVGRVHPIMEEG